VFFLYLVVFSGLLVSFVAMPYPSGDDVTRFLLEVFALAAGLVLVCYVTGENPKWQWGIPDKKK
jgi:hypothetical protein